MISRAEGVAIKFVSMVYLVRLIERNRDYHFATRVCTLAVLSALAAAIPGHGMRSHLHDRRGGLNAKESRIERISQQSTK